MYTTISSWLVPLFLLPAVAAIPGSLLTAQDHQASKPAEPRSPGRKLHGRFLHITDPHPDPHYKIHSSPDGKSVCHHGSGSAGVYGAEVSDCDSPFSLVNETFHWIDKNLRDSIDFVIWTGDSARHDNDESVPRTEKEVLHLNQYVVDRVLEVFGKPDKINDTDPTNDLIIPVIPTFGNNDILPHNVFTPGPNKWTKNYAKIWRQFIPEEQRHGFERGGWFFVEAIPNKLAVFSLNTMYFFDKNAAVDGCAKKGEPGYEHMDWLRIQLQFIRQRGMKAILTGHVPPARTESKANWDETCWQKYTLWMHQYRDVIVGTMYGHMNVDHFMLQDSEEVDIGVIKRSLRTFNSTAQGSNGTQRHSLGEELELKSASDYLSELKDSWSELPSPPDSAQTANTTGDDESIEKKKKKKHKKKKKKKSKEQKYFDKIGGEWAERYAVSHVSPSIVPNYFPTLRVFDYNITGLEKADLSPANNVPQQAMEARAETTTGDIHELSQQSSEDSPELQQKKKKNKRPKKPSFIVPDPPSKSSPPGPAYSPQSLTLLGYTQFFANLTYINNELTSTPASRAGALVAERKGTEIAVKPSFDSPKPFEFQVEYKTFNDTVYQLPDLTVRSYLRLAERIGSFDNEGNMGMRFNITKKKKGKKHRKHKKEDDEAWFTFVRRAFVGTLDEKEVRGRFGVAQGPTADA